MKQLLKGIKTECRNPISKGGSCIVKGDHNNISTIPCVHDKTQP